VLTSCNGSAKSSHEAVHVDSVFGVLGQSVQRALTSLAADGICKVAAAVFVITHDYAHGTRGMAREQTNLKPAGPSDSAGAVHLEPGVEITPPIF
jgi:hypothetical protein